MTPASPIAGWASAHLIGVGGAGMSALARVLAARGCRVTGSDIKESRGLAALRALGVRAVIGHRPENVEGASVVIASSAVPPSNAELVAAREAGIPVFQRAQVLAMLMQERRGIAVAGTHGKTTTTSMIATILNHAGLDPTFLVGGDLNETGTGAHDGQGEWLVAEADESDGSFLWLAPEIAVVTNVEADHLDYYRDDEEIAQAFAAFCGNVRAGGTVVVCADDPGARHAAESAAHIVTYGLNETADWKAEHIKYSASGLRARLLRGGSECGTLELAVTGDHNVRNALAAVAVADLAGVPADVALQGLAAFGGVARRFELRGRAFGVTVVDDYAHHPTEIRATLASARDRGFGRLFAVFQPHRYSRTLAMGAELGAALAGADAVVLTDVYGAGEQPLPGVTGKRVLDGLLSEAPGAQAAYLPARSEIARFVSARARPGDLILTMGAGDITMLPGEILARLSRRERDGGDS